MKKLSCQDLNDSIYDIRQILTEEGFAKLPRRRDEERPSNLRPEPAEIADIRQLEPSAWRPLRLEGVSRRSFSPTTSTSLPRPWSSAMPDGC